MEKLSIFREFFEFLVAHKKYVLLPAILFLLLMGLLLVSTQATPVAPFIYTIF